MSMIRLRGLLNLIEGDRGHMVCERLEGGDEMGLACSTMSCRRCPLESTETRRQTAIALRDMIEKREVEV